MEDKKLENDQGGGSKGKVLVNIDEKRDTQKATNWTGNRKMSKKNGKINNRVCFKMINIQGLTKAKYVEIEDMLNDKENNMNIICKNLIKLLMKLTKKIKNYIKK